jgi:predicted NBD/HSP70 family sugar kinase
VKQSSAEAPSIAGLSVAGLSAARPALIRAMNEHLLLEQIRLSGPCSRAELARVSGLSKPTVSLALANLERAGLVRLAGQRTGRPGRSALLYEIRPEAGFVLGLDIGLEYLRGAVCDLAGGVRARLSRAVAASSASGRLAELVRLADDLCARAGVPRGSITQTVVGSPGVYDRARNAIALTGGLPGWDRPEALAGLRAAFGPDLVIENDVDAAALAERAHGHGRDVDNFAFVHVGTGIGMGLVLGGRLHRGVHGVAGEIAFLPLGLDDLPDMDLADGNLAEANLADGKPADGKPADGKPAVSEQATEAEEERRRGRLETAAAASGIVRSARRAGLTGASSARAVFAAAERGDERASAVVAREARLLARAICCVITVVDPSLIVLGGGIGQAAGFADAVTAALGSVAPVLPEVQVSALGSDAVVDGCLAEGASLAWTQLIAALP